MTLSARVDPLTGQQAERAAQCVGLSVSDLMRAGLHRVCEEIAETGSLRVAPAQPRLFPPVRSGREGKAGEG